MWVEGWSESGGGRTSIQAPSRIVEKMGAHVDVGLQWDVKGDFISNFYFSLPSGRQGLLRVKKRWWGLGRRESQHAESQAACLQDPGWSDGFDDEARATVTSLPSLRTTDL